MYANTATTHTATTHPATTHTHGDDTHDGHAFIAFLLREFADHSLVSFHFLKQGHEEDTLRSFATVFLGNVSAPTAPKAGLIKKVSHLVVSQAVQSAQSLVPRPSIAERCRHVSRQVITHLLKLGIARTSPPYDLVAAIALDMFLRGQKAESIAHLQDAGVQVSYAATNAEMGESTRSVPAIGSRYQPGVCN